MTDQTDKAIEKPKESIFDVLKTVFYALMIALVFRTLLFQPFSIPSGSMKSTLLIGDYLFVSKYAYGYSKYALPYGHLLPDSVFGGRILSSEPERGDVIVFRHPRNDDTDYIKRVIGMPGERVQIVQGVVHINGEPVRLDRVEDFVEPNARSERQACLRGANSVDCVKRRYVETLPNEVSHVVLDANGFGGARDNTREYVVPEGHYMFLGDNRDNSEDSRGGSLGMVPAQYLIGRAEIVMLSSEGAFWEVWDWRANRFFKAIQ